MRWRKKFAVEKRRKKVRKGRREIKRGRKRGFALSFV
jgi:hypothetical protein